MSIGAFSIGEAALAQQAASGATKVPASRQAVAKPDAATLVPEAR